LADLFYGHIGGMDNFARGLEIAYGILTQSPIPQMVEQRYASYDQGQGALYEQGELGLDALRDLAMRSGEPRQRSGQYELYENIMNRWVR